MKWAWIARRAVRLFRRKCDGALSCKRGEGATCSRNYDSVGRENGAEVYAEGDGGGSGKCRRDGEPFNPSRSLA